MAAITVWSLAISTLVLFAFTLVHFIANPIGGTDDFYFTYGGCISATCVFALCSSWKLLRHARHELGKHSWMWRVTKRVVVSLRAPGDDAPAETRDKCSPTAQQDEIALSEIITVRS